MQEALRGRGRRGADPWATHAAVVVAQQKLLLSQEAERGLVNKGYEQVRPSLPHCFVLCPCAAKA